MYNPRSSSANLTNICKMWLCQTRCTAWKIQRWFVLVNYKDIQVWMGQTCSLQSCWRCSALQLGLCVLRGMLHSHLRTTINRFVVRKEKPTSRKQCACGVCINMVLPVGLVRGSRDDSPSNHEENHAAVAWMLSEVIASAFQVTSERTSGDATLSPFRLRDG